MERKDSGNRTTGLCIKQCDVLGVTRIFTFPYSPPGSGNVVMVREGANNKSGSTQLVCGGARGRL